MVQVWRVHIRPGGGTVSHGVSYQLCVDQKIVGIGWQVTEARSWEPLSLQDYLRMAMAVDKYQENGSWRTALDRLRAMKQNDLVWIRRPKTHDYHLCRVVGQWDYRDAAPYRAADIVNVRAVEMIEVEATQIPTTLAPRFMGGSTIEPIKDQAQIDATVRIWLAHNEDPSSTS